MDIKQFSQGIRFRELQPMDDPTNFYANMPYEFYNTVFPEDDTAIKNKLRFCNVGTKYCTLAIAGIINKAVQLMSEDMVYLNIGVLHGYSLFAGMLGNSKKVCIGVDNCSDPVSDPNTTLSKIFHGNWEKMKGFNQKSRFYEMDFVAYLENTHKEQIGVYFYDADHSIESQYKALVMTEKFHTPGCVIIIDDSNDVDRNGVTLAIDRFLKEREGLYETILDVKTSGNCHPTWWNGLYIFSKKG